MHRRKGIDVSYADGRIDWRRVREDRIEFAMVRAGSGDGNIDQEFERNARECNRERIPLGIYWFSYAYTKEMARREAEQCVEIIRRYRVEYPVAFDFEEVGVSGNMNFGLLNISIRSEWKMLICGSIPIPEGSEASGAKWTWITALKIMKREIQRIGTGSVRRQDERKNKRSPFCMCGRQVYTEWFFGFTSMSFFIFAFFCAESCRYTKHRCRYLRNLLLFAILSEAPFQYLVDAIGGEPLKLQFGFTNVLSTLLLGTCACFAYEEMRKRNKEWAGLLAVVLCAGSAWILNTDYHIYGVLAVFVCYIFKENKQKFVALGIVIFLLYGLCIPVEDCLTYGFNVHMLLTYLMDLFFGLGTLLILQTYHGVRGRGMKYFFYLFYPLHISLLVLIYTEV